MPSIFQALKSKALKKYSHPAIKRSEVLFIATLFTIVKRQKQPKNPVIDEYINKICYVHTMEYYSILRKKEILSFVSTWMELEDIILSEKSRSPKGKYYTITLNMRYIGKSDSYKQKTEW